jgi:hypothetical protein
MRRSNAFPIAVMLATLAGVAVLAVPARAGLMVPGYQSLPGVSHSLYLDFDGDVTPDWGIYHPGTTPAYDIDGNPDDFSPQELENIHTIWQGVAEKYSPFKLNVTTIPPTQFGAPKIVVGGDGAWAPKDSGGIAIANSSVITTFPKVGFVFPARLGNGLPKFVIEASAHEAGHGYGLVHQSLYDGGNFVKEYNPGDADRAPIMGRSYDATRGLWWHGPTPGSSTILQDDLAVLSRTGTLTPNLGYRADDHRDAPDLADPLDITADFSLSGHGIIERTSDADFFSFSTPGGTAHLVADVAPVAAMLDLSMSLYDSAGQLIRMAATASLGESMTVTLDPGVYRIGVTSAGGYGDIGQYSISGSAVPEPASAVTLAVAFGPALLARRRVR